MKKIALSKILPRSKALNAPRVRTCLQQSKNLITNLQAIPVTRPSQHTYLTPQTAHGCLNQTEKSRRVFLYIFQILPQPSLNSLLTYSLDLCCKVISNSSYTLSSRVSKTLSWRFNSFSNESAKQISIIQHQMSSTISHIIQKG